MFSVAEHTYTTLTFVSHFVLAAVLLGWLCPLSNQGPGSRGGKELVKVIGAAGREPRAARLGSLSPLHHSAPEWGTCFLPRAV